MQIERIVFKIVGILMIVCLFLNFINYGFEEMSAISLLCNFKLLMEYNVVGLCICLLLLFEIALAILLVVLEEQDVLAILAFWGGVLLIGVNVIPNLLIKNMINSAIGVNISAEIIQYNFAWWALVVLNFIVFVLGFNKIKN